MDQLSVHLVRLVALLRCRDRLIDRPHRLRQTLTSIVARTRRVS